MGIYSGNPEENVYKRISFDGKILESTEQLNWGYYSGGPMNTADLILTHHLGSDPSIKLRDMFSKDIISKFEKDKEFTLTSEEVDEWLETQGIRTNSTVKNENIVKKVCAELGITPKELAEKLGASEGTVRNWSSSNELPQWALNFINTLMEHKKDKDIVTKLKELLNLIK